MELQNQLIEKLFKSKCSQTELMTLLKYIKDNHSDIDDEVMQKLWIEMQFYPSLENQHSEAILKKTLSKIDAKAKSFKTTKIVAFSLRRRQFIKRWSVAAAFLIVGSGIGWNWFHNEEIITVSTDFAETKMIDLPDGSLVELNARSELSYNKYWCSSCDRQVRLVGEAFFDVARKEKTNQKFQVITSDLTIEVLGTAFNVNTLHDQTQVFLEEGKVKLDLNDETEEMLMKPGDVVTYSIQTKKKEKIQFQKEESIVWKNGFTSMKNISIFIILQKLEDIYGVEFKVQNDEHRNRKFTIGIPVNNFETTLTVLKEVTKLGIVKIEQQYVVE